MHTNPQIHFHFQLQTMAPASKKGTGKASARDRRSSSRHSTPMSALTDTAPDTPSNATPSSTSQPAPALPRETPYLHTPTAYLISADLDLNALIDKSHPPSLKPHDPPTARELHTLHDKIRDNVLKSLEKRGETCERNLRAVVQKRKESAQQERDREAAEQQQAADRIKKERDDGAKSKKIGQKRSHAESEDAEDKKQNVPSVGEHMLARQDGVGVHEGMLDFLTASSRKVLSRCRLLLGSAVVTYKPAFTSNIPLLASSLQAHAHRLHLSA